MTSMFEAWENTVIYCCITTSPPTFNDIKQLFILLVFMVFVGLKFGKNIIETKPTTLLYIMWELWWHKWQRVLRMGGGWKGWAGRPTSKIVSLFTWVVWAPTFDLSGMMVFALLNFLIMAQGSMNKCPQKPGKNCQFFKWLTLRNLRCIKECTAMLQIGLAGMSIMMPLIDIRDSGWERWEKNEFHCEIHVHIQVECPARIYLELRRQVGVENEG